MTIELGTTLGATSAQELLEFPIPYPMEIFEVYLFGSGTQNGFVVIRDADSNVEQLSTDADLLHISDDPNHLLVGFDRSNGVLVFKDFDPITVGEKIAFDFIATGTLNIQCILFAKRSKKLEIPVSLIRDSLEDRKQVIDYRHSERDVAAIVAGEGGHQVRIRGRKQVGVEY